MSTISTTSHGSSTNLNLIIASITLVAILAFVIAQVVAAPEPATGSLIASENAYLEYLRGEKTIFANPHQLDEALSAYYLGEHKVYIDAAERNSALWGYHFGEKFIVPFDAREAALWEYRQGEKAIP